MIKFIIISCAVLAGFAATAQSITSDAIKWSSEEFLEESKNVYISHESYFLSYGSDSVVWYQAGDFRQTVKVTGIEGSWADLNTNGSITYNVLYHDKTGTLKFQRDGDWISIRMQIAGLPGNPAAKLFTITSFNQTEL